MVGVGSEESSANAAEALCGHSFKAAAENFYVTSWIVIQDVIITFIAEKKEDGMSAGNPETEPRRLLPKDVFIIDFNGQRMLESG